MNDIVVEEEHIFRLAEVFGRVNYRLRGARDGLGQSLFTTLAAIDVNGPIRFGDLARHEYVSSPTMTRLVAELESRGFVTRQVDETDRRAYLLTASETGVRELRERRESRAVILGRLLATVPSDDLAPIWNALPVLESLTVGGMASPE